MTREMTLADQIIASLREEPDQWDKGEFYLSHKNGVKIWICNGLWYLEVMGKYYRTFNILQKLRLSAAIRRWSQRPITINEPGAAA